MKALTKISIGFLALAAVALWFTSCSSEDVTSGTNQGRKSLLTLSINTGNVNNTRANDWIGSAPTDESKIQSMTVGIFTSEGKVRTIVELKAGSGVGTKLSDDGQTATIVTTQLTSTDKVLVAVNAVEGKFQGVQTADDFKGKTVEADVALCAGAEKETQDVSKTPMFGSGDLKNTEGETKDKNFTASVNVYHMLSKIHLQALNVQFNENGAFKDASFTPTDIFMVNVPNDVKFNVTSNTDASAWTNTSTFLHGWGNDGYTDANSLATGMGDYKKYLTTGALTPATELNRTSGSFGKEVYFYTLPNGKTDPTNRTKLVIAGTFKNNSSDVVGTKVYYPVPINAKFENSGDVKPAVDGTTPYAVYPNKVYNCTVNIKAKGASTPNESLDPQTASVTVTVEPYNSADQTTNFE